MKNLEKSITRFDNLLESWSVERLGDYFEFYNGLSLSRNLLNESSDTLCLHYGDIHLKDSLTSFNTIRDRAWLPKVEIEDISKLKDGVLLEDGDIVFADASEDYEGIGKSIVVENEDDSCFVSGLHTIVAKDRTEKIDINYKKYFLKPQFIRKQFRRVAAGSSVFGVNKTEIANFKFLLPSLKEQKKIASILQCVDAKIEYITDKIQDLTQLKKALSQKLLTEGIGHIEFKDSEVGRIPVEWEVKKLCDISNIIMGQSPKSSTCNEDVVGIPFYQGKTEFGYMYPEVKKWCTEPLKIAESLDILISVRAPVGTVNICEEKSCIGRGLAAVRQTKDSFFKFLYYLLDYSSDKLNEVGQGSTFTAINSNDLANFNVRVPTMEEQQNIANILFALDTQIIQHQAQKSDYTQLKQGLMQQLLTGKIKE